MATDTFATLGKQEAIRQLFEGTKFKPFEEPVFFHSPERSYITTSTKSFLEGIDFDLVYFPLKHLGYKCVLATTAELFAVMSHPRTLSICLGVSAKLDFEQVKELWSGVLAAAYMASSAPALSPTMKHCPGSAFSSGIMPSMRFMAA